MRILWFGKDSAHLTSAYAKINDELVCRRLSKYHECALFCTVGLSYGCFDVGDVTVYPGMGDMSGQNLFLDHYRDFKADLYITSYDIWPLDKLPQSAAKGEILWVPWAYVDYDPVSPVVTRLLPAVKVVPTSSWLEGELQKAGLRNVSEPIIPGVNQEVFKSIIGTRDEEEKEITKERLKKALGFPPDCFLAGIFQMNQLYRKPFDIQMEGLEIFQKNNPNVKTRIWIHASPRVKHGWMLPELAKEHGFDHNRGDVKFADQYTLLKGLHGYNEDHMSRLYSTLDVLINCTTGDSPGMPILEAQSCMPGNETITTVKDVKLIKDIKVGDELLFSTVLRVFDRDYCGNLITIKPKGLLPRNFTANHPILTAKGLKKAGDLTTEDFVAVPKFPSIKNINPKLAKFYGIYVGDGYMEHGAIVLCPRDRTQAKEWAHLGVDIFNGAYIQKVANRVKIPKWLSADLSSRAGKDAETKRVPIEIFTTTIEAKKAFLQGLIDADGYIYESSEKLRATVTTTSKGLIDDLVILLASLGIHASVRIKRRPTEGIIKGRAVSLNECYTLTIFGNDASFILNSPRKFKNVGCKRGFVNESYVFYRLEKLVSKPFEGKVYNFQTSEGMYTVPFIVHNCGTPVLTTNFCCFPEFTRAGYTVKVARYFRPPHLPMLRKALPDPYDIADKLEKIYNSDAERWRKIGPEFISQFTWDNCLRGWLSVLSEVEEEIDRSCLRIPKPSETLKPLAEKIQVLA